MVGQYAVVVLAAGASRRMGSAKQALVIEQEPLLTRMVRLALASDTHDVFVVLGADYLQNRRLVDALDAIVVHHDQWERGMGSSIKAGVKTVLRKFPSIDGVVIMACDQPYVTAIHIDRLIATHRAKKLPVIASAYAGTIGIPVLFSGKALALIPNIGDSEGAKSVINQFREQTTVIDLPKGEIDLDTPTDYHNFIVNNKQ